MGLPIFNYDDSAKSANSSGQTKPSETAPLRSSIRRRPSIHRGAFPRAAQRAWASMHSSQTRFSPPPTNSRAEPPPLPPVPDVDQLIDAESTHSRPASRLEQLRVQLERRRSLSRLERASYVDEDEWLAGRGSSTSGTSSQHIENIEERRLRPRNQDWRYRTLYPGYDGRASRVALETHNAGSVLPTPPLEVSEELSRHELLQERSLVDGPITPPYPDGPMPPLPDNWVQSSTGLGDRVRSPSPIDQAAAERNAMLAMLSTVPPTDAPLSPPGSSSFNRDRHSDDDNASTAPDHLRPRLDLDGECLSDSDSDQPPSRTNPIPTSTIRHTSHRHNRRLHATAGSTRRSASPPSAVLGAQDSSSYRSARHSGNPSLHHRRSVESDPALDADLEQMRGILDRLSRRQDIPEEWWMSAGLGRAMAARRASGEPVSREG